MPNERVTFQQISNPSSILALFQNNHDDVVALCSFSLLSYALKSLILPLDEAHILLMNVSNVTRICDDTFSLLPGCAQCIYVLPRTCTLHTNDMYILPHVTDCIRDIDYFNRTLQPKTHVTNLAVLASYFDSEDLTQLTASTSLNQPIAAVLPNLTFLDNRNFSDTLAALEQTKFDLAKAVNLPISRQMLLGQ